MQILSTLRPLGLGPLELPRAKRQGTFNSSYSLLYFVPKTCRRAGQQVASKQTRIVIIHPLSYRLLIHLSV